MLLGPFSGQPRELKRDAFDLLSAKRAFKVLFCRALTGAGSDKPQKKRGRPRKRAGPYQIKMYT